MFSVRWFDKAADDVVDIVSYIAKENPIAAARYGEELFQTVELLRFMPEIFRVWEVGERFRCCAIVKPYLIIYQVDNQNNIIHIVRIIHSKRQVDDIGQ